MGPSCHGLEALNAKLDTYFAQGLTRDQIRRALVADHGGQDILTSPIDSGFNRLAWMFPYIVGIVGAGAIALAAKRWSRHDAASQREQAVAADGALNVRLDDELRDLD